jgi:hypothetical protein
MSTTKSTLGTTSVNLEKKSKAAWKKFGKTAWRQMDNSFKKSRQQQGENWEKQLAGNAWRKLGNNSEKTWQEHGERLAAICRKICPSIETTPPQRFAEEINLKNRILRPSGAWRNLLEHSDTTTATASVKDTSTKNL